MSSTPLPEPEPSIPTNRKLRFRIIACGLFLVLFQLWTIRSGLPLALSGAADFRMLYAAGTMVRTGQSARLYDFNYEQQVQQQVVGPSSTTLPYMYPLYAAFPAAPLSLLPYRIAYLAMFALNLALLLAASFVLRPYLPALTRLWPPLPAIVFLAFLPVGIALLQGQVSLLLLLLFCGAFAAIKRSHPFLAGLLLSVALIKPHVVLPVILLFALWRNWRLIAGFITGALALCILSLPFAGIVGLATYARFMLHAASTGSLGAAQNKYDMFSGRMPNLHGFFVTLSGGAHWGTICVIVSSAAVLFWTALQPPSLPRAIVASILVSYNLHPHDLSLLLIPICLIFNQVLDRTSQPASHKPTQLDEFSAATALLWMVSPFGLILLGNGWNYLLAPAMLPFLFRRDPLPYTLDPGPYTLPPGLKRSLPFYIFKRWFKPGSPILLFEHLHRTYGNMASYRLMRTNIVFVNNPDYIREILINQAPSFVKERTLNRMKILLGEGLITSDDPIHKRQRKIAAPAFHRQRIAAYADTIVASASAHANRWKSGETIDVNAAMMDLSLEIIARTLFDLEVTPDIRSINDEVNSIMDIYNFLVAMPRLESWLHLPIPILNRFRRSRSRLNAIVDRIIRDHRASGVDKGDLLSMLIASRYEADEQNAPSTSNTEPRSSPEGMSDEQIRDEVLTIFLAGYETVANALTWTWYCLSQNPAAKALLHAELDRVLRPLDPGPSTLNPRSPTLADYPSLPYTEQVFAESMRLYPPAWAMGRRSTRPIQLGPYHMPAGTHFFFSQYIMHRTEEYFPDPLRFDPTRHTPEAKAARQKFTYFPFGGGGRQCIGESFAWTEGVLALATIASRWRMTYLGDTPPFLQAKITLRPRDALLMRLEAR
jgi:cytochrome P450